MPHAQQQILDALQGVLAAGGTVAGARVFLDRVDPLQPGELPAILIAEEADGESAEVVMISGEQRRTLDVSIGCVIANAITAAASARAFGLEVEKLLAPSTALHALCNYGFEIIESRQENSGDSDRLLAARHQRWRFHYLVSPLAPDVIL